jgi:starch-binding outer membrane protein, SusD/RagB family
LRRWKVADQSNVLNGRKYTGMKVTQVKDVNGNVTGYKYTRVVVDAKPSVFLPKMYYMPIPQSEITKNSNLQQNPGW